MKYLRQDGYTLLLTLVLIVLLFLVTATFTVASMNQTKQIASVDTTIVSTSLAEMGVEFVDSSFKKSYYDYKNEAITKKNNKNNKTLTANELQALNNEFSNSIEALKGKTLPLNKIENTVVSKYTITDIIPSETTDKLIFEVLVTGYDESKTKLITAKFEVDKITDANAVDQTFKTSSFEELYSKNPEIFFVVDESHAGNHANISFGDKITYFKPDNSTDTITIGQQFKDGGLNNTYFYSSGNLLFNKHTTFSNIHLQAKKLSILSNAAPKAEITGSTIVVEDAYIKIGSNDKNNKKNMSLINESKLCISNPTTSNLQETLSNLIIDTSSFVIIRSANEYTEGRHKYLNDANFLSECKLSTPILDNTIDPLIEVKY